MAADLGFIAHAAQGETRELPAHGPGNRLSEARLPHSRRPYEAEQWLAIGRPTLHASIVLHAAHRQVLQDALFHLLQVVVVVVQNLACLRHVDFAAGARAFGAYGGTVAKSSQLDDAVKGSKESTQPITLLAVNDDYIRTFTINYHGGERHPHLVEVSGQPDYLDESIKPRAAGK